jgi:nitrogenase molybdenum-iron protein beta chain
MAHHILPHSGCALHGAIRTAQAIGGLVPLIHSNTGCGMQAYLGDRFSGLNFGHGGWEVPSTAVIERHIVFGGGSRLREQLKNTVKVIGGEACIILDGCEAAMVGDDMAAMAKESLQQGHKVLHCETAGFRGNSRYGYTSVMTEIIRALPLLGAPEPASGEKIVNIFGLIPGISPYLRGDLEELTRLLRGIGLRANVFFEPQGLDGFRHAPAAVLSLVFSRWGLAPAHELETLCGVPVLEFKGAPVGYAAVAAFLSAIIEQLGLPSDTGATFLTAEKRRFYDYLALAADQYYEERVARNVAIVADEAPGVALAEFLSGQLGANIQFNAVSDADAYEPLTVSALAGAEILLASAQEQPTAEALGLPLLEISYPLSAGVVLNKSYLGINGALRLTEDYVSALVAANRAKREQIREQLQKTKF